MNYKDTYNSLSDIEKHTIDIAPRFTPLGYKTLKLPDYLKNALKNIWLDNMENSTNENTNNSDKFVYHSNKKLDLRNINSLMFNLITTHVHTLLSKWTKLNKLIWHQTYGFREYKQNATLPFHVDRYKTHVLSAIINVHQYEINKPWPLILYDHNKKYTELYFDEDTDIVLYESATIIHGRPLALYGKSYVNLFAHFSTEGWDRVVNKIDNVIG